MQVGSALSTLWWLGEESSHALVTCMTCFAPSTRMAWLLQPKAKYFSKQGTGPAWGTGTVTGDLARGPARVLVPSTDGALWGGLGVCWRKHVKSNSILKKWRNGLKNNNKNKRQARVFLGRIPLAGAGCITAGRTNAGHSVCRSTRTGGELGGQWDREDVDGRGAGPYG